MITDLEIDLIEHVGIRFAVEANGKTKGKISPSVKGDGEDIGNEP